MAKLQKRSKKNNWEVCYPLPAKLRELLRTPALNRSLGTPDKTEAKRRFPMKLVEVEAEVVGLMAKHFPDDDTAMEELHALIRDFKQADDTEPVSGGVTEKDLLRDAMVEWADRQRSRRLRAYRGTPQFETQKEVANDLRDKAEALVLEAIDPRRRIDELVEHWRQDVKPRLSKATQEEYERAIGRFLGWCKSKRYLALPQIDRPAVRAFVNDCYRGKLGKTVKLALGALRGVWDHAFTIGWMPEKSRVWLDHDYSDRVRIGTGETKDPEDAERAFSFDDIRALLQGIQPTAFCDMYRLGLITGARSAEMSALRWEHLKRRDDGYWLTVPGTKTGNAKREVPIPSAFTPLVERLAGHDGPHLIPLYPGKSWLSDRDRNRYINKELNRKRRDLGLPDQDKQGVHSTRRTYVELMEGAGIPVDTTKLLIGHKRTDITHGLYSKGAYVDLRSAVEKLEYPADIVVLINGGR